MTRRFFVTGTDTNIGKTLAVCALLQAAVRAGYRAAGYKPVASGCELTQDGVRSRDVLALMANSNIMFSYQQVNPLAFLMPTSPHIASREEGRQIDFAVLSAGLRLIENSVDWLVIEGSGGWFTPLTESLYYADWVITEQLPVIMVVGMRLGCINHALLTAMAIQQAGLSLIGWIANYNEPIKNQPNGYLISLKQQLSVPLLGIIPWLNTCEKVPLADYLNFTLLSDLS